MDNKTNTRTVSLKDLFAIFFHRLWIIVLAAGITVIGVFVVHQVAVEPRYSSTATVYILRQGQDELTSSEAYTDFSVALKVVNDCNHLLKSHTVLDEVIDRLALDIEYEELYDSISTETPEETRVLEVTVEADSPELAKTIVDCISTVGIESINEVMGYEQVGLYELGTLNEEPSNERGLPVYLLAGLGVAVLTYAVFLLIHVLDDTIKTDQDIERSLGLSILGDIPDANATHKKGYGYRGYKGYGRYGSSDKTL